VVDTAIVVGAAVEEVEEPATYEPAQSNYFLEELREADMEPVEEMEETEEYFEPEEIVEGTVTNVE